MNRVNKRERVLIGHVGVDSGQMMLCDPCYIESHWSNDSDFDRDAAGREQTNREDFSYAGAAETTLSKPSAGILGDGLGAVCSTGLGDGFYPVYVEYEDFGTWGRRVVSMFIDFNEEFECAYCGTEQVDQEGELCGFCDISCPRCGEQGYADEEDCPFCEDEEEVVN